MYILYYKNIPHMEKRCCEIHDVARKNMMSVLNGHTSGYFHLHSAVLRGSILGPTHSLIFINELPGIITSQIGIYADITVSSSLNRKSV